MLGTRAAAFAGRIFNLRESILRIQNGTTPQPTCVDLANMLRYFSQVLHDFRDFKDIENVPLYANEKKDHIQLIKTLPNFDYCGLYKALAQLVDILPLIPHSSNGYDQLGANLLMLLKCLVPFLDQINMESMPYLVSTLFMSLPQAFHKDILDTLCFNLLPFTIDQQQRNTIMMLQKGKTKQRQMEQEQETATSHCIVRIENPNDDINDSSMINVAPDESNQSAAQQQNDLEDQGIVLDDDSSSKQDISIDEGYAMLSVTSILMVSFHYIQDPTHHSQLIESLMKLKNNVFEDLLFVIAYGTTRARCPATEILFRYWPDICPSQQDRKNSSQANKLKHIPWKPTKCQNKNCSFTTLDDDEAVKMCLDFKISIGLSGLPPPMLVCLDCVDSIYKQQLASPTPTGTETIGLHEQSTPARTTTATLGAIQTTASMEDYSSKFIDLLLPMERVSKLCENKKCKSTDRVAIGTCFDIECANYNGKRPMRYCKTCFLSIHEPCEANNYDVTLQNHIRHSSIKLNIWQSEEQINNFVEAIISLLKEAAPADRPSKDSERNLRSLMGPVSPFSSDNKDGINMATEERQLISQYGIWLMTGLCKSVEKLSDELLGRLLGMLFQWFHFTACLPDDQAGSALEKLKGECIKGWIMEVKNKRLNVFIHCLLPHPIDCSKIGGHWEVWPDTAYQIKEGFKRLLCLVPYDIITDDVWDEIMPNWMECFRHEVPENELNELKILLSKVFDPELSPLGFETKQMYNFISSRFEDSTNTNQEQTLYWLQIITMLEIPIPIDFLYQMLRSCVKSLAEMRNNELNQMRSSSSSRGFNDQQQARTNGKPSRSSSSSSTSESDDDDGADTCRGGVHGDSMSVAEDDVLLPNAHRESDNQHSASHQRGELTQQERQARARAAFSAKLIQHANLLDAQHNNQSPHHSVSASATPIISPSSTIANQMGGNGSGSTSSCRDTASTKTHQQSAPPPSKSETVSSLMSTQQTNQSNLTIRHSQPLRSTADSQASVVEGESEKQRKQQHADQRHKTKTRDKQEKRQRKQQQQHQSSSSSEKPAKNLRLNLDSIDDFTGISKIDNNLVCYILMMDVLLKQLDLQEINSHRGLHGKEAQQAIDLLNSIISTPWLGRHTCCDMMPFASSGSPTMMQQQTASTSSYNNNAFASTSSESQQFISKQQQPQHQYPTSYHSFGHCAQGFEHEDSFETCVFCEIICTFHKLAMKLIKYFSPLIEVSICEVSQDAANGEFDGKPDYSRIGIDHLNDPTTATAVVGGQPMISQDDAVGLQQAEEAGSREFNFSTEQRLNRLLQQQDPSSPFSPSYLGPTLKQEILHELPKELQLAYNLLVQFHQYQTPDIVSQLLQMIKLISLHSQVLSEASKNNQQFITWCQHNMLVNKLWSLCQLESSEIARTCVPLLMHCITLPWGVRLFRDLVERDFNSENRLSRFRAVERVVTIAYFCEPSTIKNSTLLQSTMASAFCYVVRCLDDIEAIVAQRALVSLEMMKTSSLKLLLWCLEVQFDYIIIDRPMILRSVFQLYNHLRDRRFLTWDFFLNRFDTIFLEAQIYLQQTGEIPSFTMQDLKNTNTKSEIYQKKISRAKEALHETHHSRSLSSRFNEQKFTNISSSTSSSAAAAAAAATAGVAGGAASACLSTNQQQQDTDVYLQQQYKQSIALQQKLQRQASGNLSQQHYSDVPGGGGGGGVTKGVSLDCLSTPSAQQSSRHFFGQWPTTTTTSQPQSQQKDPQDRWQNVSPVRRILQHGQSTSSRYQSIAFLTSQSLAKRKNSKFMSNLAMQSVPPLMSLPDKLHQHLPNSFVDDGSKLNEIAQENHVFGVVHRVCDEDRDTNHSLVFLLMQFFSKPDPSHPQSVKTLNRSHQIVLRHMNILMGYSIARKNFLIPATNLRLLPVFNAFLTSLPKVLDFNYQLGTILLETCLPVLIYCPAPEEVQYDLIRTPNYSLWLLNPLMRQSWLMSVMAFLYKYQFSQAHLKDYVYKLMWIVINTLESHLNYSALELIPLDRRPATVGSGSGGGGSGNSSNNTTNNGAQQTTAATAQQTSNQDAETSLSEDQVMPTITKVPSTADIGSPAGKTTGAVDDPKATESAKRDHEKISPRSSNEQQRSPTTARSVGGSKPPTIMKKAETSDNLNVRATAAAAAGAATKSSIQKPKNELHSTSPSKEAQKSSVGSGGPKTSQSTTCISFADARSHANEERLLPIGGGGAGRSKPAITDHSTERLLPIGPTLSSSSASGGTQQTIVNPLARLPSADRLLAQNKDSRPTGEKSGGSSKPLPGLRGNLMASNDANNQTAAVNRPAITLASESPMITASSSSSSSTTNKTIASVQLAKDQSEPTTSLNSPQSTSSKLSASGAVKLGGGKFSGSKQQNNEHSNQSSDSQSHPAATTTANTRASPFSVGGSTGGGQTRKAKLANKFGVVVGGGSSTNISKQQQQQGTNEHYQTANQKQQGVGGDRAATLRSSYSCPSLLNDQLAQLNRHSFVQEFSDKDLSLCLVILETFIHHEPSMAAQLLPNILRLVARYSSSNVDSWQTGSNVHLVGGSMFVARQFIRVALHDLMENNIFHQIFTSHFTGYEFYKSMATALADFSDLNQLAPLSKLFEDLNKQKNLPQASSLMTILENVATYFECVISETTAHSQTTWNSFIINWENFLRKLILALPRYSGIAMTSSSGGNNQANGRGGGGFDSSGASGSGANNQGALGQSQQAGVGGSAGQAGGNNNQMASGVGGGGGHHADGMPASGPNAFMSSRAGGISASNSATTSSAQQQQVGGNATANNFEQQQQQNNVPSSCSMIMVPIMRIILSTTKIPHLASCKTIVDPYSKIISYTVLNSQFKYEHLLEINHNCCRLYTRDREKYLIQRTIAYELVQVLKFRFFILEENLLLLLLFVLHDVGGILPPKLIKDNLKIDRSTLNQADSFITNVSECLRQHIGDLLEFITDVHAISRINDNLIGSRPSSINHDSFGGHVKAAISQYLALEVSLTNADNRTILRYLPWLYNSPSLQQGPREFIDCISHIRQLSWIILGSLQHSALIRDFHHQQQHGTNGGGGGGGGSSTTAGCQSALSTSRHHYTAGGGGGGAGQMAASQGGPTSIGGGGGGNLGSSSLTPLGGSSASGGGHSSSGGASFANCQPIPIDKNSNVAEHVQVILAGFAEQSKESVLHMSGLFHAFLLCQLWTMYCENICSQHAANSEQYRFCQSTLDDFWSKITPGVLRLVGHSRVMSEMVSTHFLQLIESLIESNSSILIKYLPLWNSVFYSYRRRNKSGNLAIRLQKCIEWQPPDLNEQDVEQNKRRFLNWLQKVQYKMSHIEIQSSQAAPFYLS